MESHDEFPEGKQAQAARRHFNPDDNHDFDAVPIDFSHVPLPPPAPKKCSWQPMKTAPKGIPTEDAGVPGSSIWFLGKLKDGTVREMQRLPRSFSYTWKDREETYYAEELLIGWLPLPEQALRDHQRQCKSLVEIP